MLIAISGPSGSGKTTIVREMLGQFPELVFSVSATTRARRPNETEGIDYFFLSKEEFISRLQTGDLIEWEEVFGNYYGTLHSAVDARIEEGKHVLFDVDVKGALSIKRIYQSQATLIFILPPDVETLRQRLIHRNTDSEEVIQHRLARIELELEASKEFHHVVLNDDLQNSVPKVAAIIRSVCRVGSDVHSA